MLPRHKRFILLNKTQDFEELNPIDTLLSYQPQYMTVITATVFLCGSLQLYGDPSSVRSYLSVPAKTTAGLFLTVRVI